MPNLVLNGTRFFGAPKNAGTTVRMWLKHYEGDLPDFSARTDYYTLREVGMPRLWHDNLVHEPRFFSPAEPGGITWCIKRDPVDRFVSAYTDKVVHERLVTWSVDACLTMLETGAMEALARTTGGDSLAACHFLPQHRWLGRDVAFYDHVFDIADMARVRQFCEDVVFRMPLPALHARHQARSGHAKVRLTPAQTRRAEAVFGADYDLGWR